MMYLLKIFNITVIRLSFLLKITQILIYIEVNGEKNWTPAEGFDLKF